ncbi:uncharacterized protein LOC132902882 [Amyelois transitella]|uniref:uncharacterized protein LOC132902882 n=1 Tax=Amyelois transitella TaxID=680683 RepID=UPI00298FDE8A|nr:uncharacterized protein LOC132902882 [Amyelois transitella]
MNMSKLSDEYYERNCFLKTETVPTQSVMKKRMTPALAKVYFNSMRPKLKVLAGLAPPMKGGGNDWFIPPEELLKGRVVMKPMKKEFLSKLGFDGIAHFGEKIVADHNRRMAEYKKKKLQESDEYWKNTIDAKCRQEKEECEMNAARENTKKIELAFHQYCFMYSTSLTKLEDLLFTAAIRDIKRVKAEALQYMRTRYETMLKQQATTLYDYYTERLMNEKDRLKSEFIRNLEEARTNLGHQIHDINVEKHLAIEKLRNLLECQNLACQVYVALKEREVCAKEIQELKQIHTKETRRLKEQMAVKDFEIQLAREKEQKRLEFQNIWYKKICEVVKKFQLFVSYSLKELPEYADFFINTEKLLLMQFNEIVESPVECGNIFECEKQSSFHTPIPQPHPYFLFCDKSYKPNIDQNLCPKHCTSSASQLPVIVVNKRCIYAACDTFEMFTDKVIRYMHGKRGDDSDFADYRDYRYSVPVKCTQSDQIHELKLESSLLQLLQNEWTNVRKLSLECCKCKIPYCFCSRLDASPLPNNPEPSTVSSQTLKSLPSGNKIVLRSVELEHERQPKWESFMEYVKSKKCKCSKMAKKHLQEHLPPYMRQMSIYEAPDLPNYEICDLDTLRKLVKRAQGKRTPPPEPEKPEPRTRDVETQYSDLNLEYLCTCLSDEEADNFLQTFIRESKLFDSNLTKTRCKVVSASLTPSYLGQETPSFATRRAYSLKDLLDESPKLEEIFRKKDCKFD